MWNLPLGLCPKMCMYRSVSVLKMHKQYNHIIVALTMHSVQF